MEMLLRIFILLCISYTISTNKTKTSFHEKLFNELAKNYSDENIVLSPSSIRNCLALVFMAANGMTASELYDTLELDGKTKEEVGKNFRNYRKKLENSGVQLRIANRVYLTKELEVSLNFQQLATKYFNVKIEKVNFKSTDTVKQINAWVESQTNHKIKEIVTFNHLQNSKILLIDALYFKANWKYAFKKLNTKLKDFHITNQRKKAVPMMERTAKLNYINLPELDAKAIELPYQKTEIRMLVILPNAIDGLFYMERKMKNFDLNNIKFTTQNVHVQLPKFKIEFDCLLKEVLKQLGIKLIFEDKAELTGMTFQNNKIKIKDITQKTFIEVDEKGTRAAVATAIKLVQVTSMNIPKRFIVDHPFFFAIKDNETIYFAGHVTKF